MTLVVAVFAVYRVSRMLVFEDGPFDVFSTIRGRIDPNQSSWIGRGIRCIACVSFWIAGVAALVIGSSWVEWLGIAGGALVVFNVSEQ